MTRKKCTVKLCEQDIVTMRFALLHYEDDLLRALSIVREGGCPVRNFIQLQHTSKLLLTANDYETLLEKVRRAYGTLKKSH